MNTNILTASQKRTLATIALNIKSKITSDAELFSNLKALNIKASKKIELEQFTGRALVTWSLGRLIIGQDAVGARGKRFTPFGNQAKTLTNKEIFSLVDCM